MPWSPFCFGTPNFVKISALKKLISKKALQVVSERNVGKITASKNLISKKGFSRIKVQAWTFVVIAKGGGVLKS